jgi:Holliday junction DNA helicase RuvA
MIHHLDGILAEKRPGRVVVELGGLGLEALVSDGTLASLPSPGTRVVLLTHLSVREDAWTLFAFEHEEERAFFRLLLSVTGVGPRVALSILSGLRVDKLRMAVMQGDVAALTQIAGVGKKTAQRMIVDLRDKLGATGDPDLVPGAARVTVGAPSDDAVDALVALGYSRPTARDAVSVVRAGNAELPLEEVVKLALRRL